MRSLSGTECQVNCAQWSMSSVFYTGCSLLEQSQYKADEWGLHEICEKNICNDAGCVYNMHCSTHRLEQSTYTVHILKIQSL